MAFSALRTLSILLMLAVASSAQAAERAYASIAPGQIQWTRDQIRANSPGIQLAYRELIEHADRIMSQKPGSVMDKAGVAASGDKHDFYSMARYSWKDEDASSSKAYVTRDGKQNPEAQSAQYDKKTYNEIVRNINTLSIAYYLSGKDAYAKKAGQLLDTWFISPATRMNPNFQYAAIRPGANDGDFRGIIEGVVLVEMLDYVRLLEGSSALTEAQNQQLKSWFGQLSDWLVNSDFGRKEAQQTNNHGTWYRTQVIAFSLYAGNEGRARSMMDPVRKLLRSQFAANGSMPREMARANSAMYSVYGLRAFIYAAGLGSGSGPSLWQEQADGKPILRQALTFLAPFYAGQQRWTSGTVHSHVDPYAIQVFRLGAAAYRTQEFDSAVSHLMTELPATDRQARLMAPPPSASGQ